LKATTSSLSLAVVVFAAVVSPRMAVDTFPELTAPVLVIVDPPSPRFFGGEERPLEDCGGR